jgi:transposase
MDGDGELVGNLEATTDLFIAIELSGTSWLVGALGPRAQKVSRYLLKSGDSTGLLDLLRTLRGRVEGDGRRVNLISCYEAGFDGFWLDRLLKANGVNNHVIDPASIRINRKARRAKTDALDVEALINALIAWKRGDQRACSMVRVPSSEEEDARRITREREALIKDRIRYVNRIKGLLATQGIYNYEPLRARRRERLMHLQTGDGHTVPPRLQGELSRLVERLELVLTMLKEVEKERDRQVAASIEAGGAIGHLTKLRGIGPEMAMVLYGEAFVRAFNNRRQVAAYAGLTPSPWSSGSLQREQGISKAGNPRLRRTMVELSWLWLRYQPNSRLSEWFRQRVRDGKGRVKRIAIVALARKLIVALWRYHDAGVVPEGCLMKG